MREIKPIEKEKIQQELSNIEKHFANCDSNKFTFLHPLMEKCAFLKVTLDELEIEICNSDVVEEYQNGNNQFGKKTSASVSTYNQLIKTYTSVLLKLNAEIQMSRIPYSPMVNQIRNKIVKPEDTETEQEHQDRINKEIERAIQLQRKQREEESRN